MYLLNIILNIKMDINVVPIDILRETALKLPLKDILKFCQTNKRFQEHICHYKPFWEALFLREVNEKVEIPKEADIEWFQYNLQQWPTVKKVADLIRKDECYYQFDDFSEELAENWNSFEIVIHLLKLNVSHKYLEKLPDMPNLEILICGSNELTNLPEMPKIKSICCKNNKIKNIKIYDKLITLACDYNLLTSIPYLPKLKILYCENNQITILPSLPKLLELDCRSNQLTTLPFYPRLERLYSTGNPLPFYSLVEWKKYWSK